MIPVHVGKYIPVLMGYFLCCLPRPKIEVTESGQPIPFILAEEYGLGFILSDLVFSIDGWTSWWFQRFFMFTPIVGEDDPIWLIFFKWVETTNQGWLWRYGRSEILSGWHLLRCNVCLFWGWYTLWKFNRSPLKSYQHPIGQDHLPPTIFKTGASC